MDLVAGILAAAAVLALFWPGLRHRWRTGQWANLHWRVSRPGKRLGLSRLFVACGAVEMDRLCRQAGRPYGLTGSTFLLVQWTLAGGTGLLTGASGGIMPGLLIGGMGWYGARFWLKATAEARQRRIGLELPTFLDLWSLLVSSGESLAGGLVEIVRHHPDWLVAAEMRLILDRVAASGLLGDTLVAGARETGATELITVAEQVRHLLDGGGRPSVELARMAQRLREERMARLVQSAGVAAVVAIFPKLFGVFLSLLPVVASILLTVAQQL